MLQAIRLYVIASQGANVTLTPGAVAETVNLNGDAATLIQTENAQIGQ